MSSGGELTDDTADPSSDVGSSDSDEDLDYERDFRPEVHGPPESWMHQQLQKGIFCEDEERFQLVAESVNCTCWATLKRRLRTATAHVVLAQEVGTFAEQIEARSAWARKHGWHSVWVQSKKCASGKPSAGVAIFARPEMALRCETAALALPANRVVTAIISPPGWPDTRIGCAYLKSGAGPRGNADILAALGMVATIDGLPTLIGGDWNLPPHVVAATGFPAKARGCLITPRKGAATCVTGVSSSQIDYFFCNGGLEEANEGVKVITDAAVATHRPVQITFAPQVAEMHMLVIARARPIPTARPVGPRRAPPSWNAAIATAEEALRAAREEKPMVAVAALSVAYRWLVNTVADSAARATDMPNPQRGMAGLRPRYIWVPIFGKPKEVIAQERDIVATCWKWLLDRSKELVRLAEDCAGDDPSPRLIDTLMQHAVYAEADYPIASGISSVLDQAVSHYKDMAARIKDTGAIDKVTLAEVVELAHAAVRDMLPAKAEADKAADEEDKEAWTTWRETALIGGGGKWHAATKAKPKWSPYVITTSSGRLSTRPAEQLDYEAEQLEHFWKAHTRAPVIRVDNRDALPRASPAEIEAAACTFPERTCHGASDGLHPRHWALIEDEGRTATAILFEALETLGIPPEQLQQLLVTLIDKPAGGFRPIVLFAPLQRLWTRVRRKYAVEWMTANDRPYWASGKGQSPEDNVWRQSVRDEAAHATKMDSATSLADLRKYFESIDLDRLKERAIRWGVNPVIVKVCINLYKCARVVTQGRRVRHRWAWAVSGVPAGCGLADLWIQVYAISGYDTLASRIPATISVYYDDIVLAIIGSRKHVVKGLTKSVKMLHEMIREDLDCEVAMEKLATDASTKAIKDDLTASLGKLAPFAAARPVKLGVDLFCNRSVRHGPGSKRQKRWRNTMKTARRMRAWAVGLRGMAKRRARNALLALTRGSYGYGAKVHGVSDHDLRVVRRSMVALDAPTGAGASLTAKLILADDPAWSIALGPVLSWGAEVWRALNCPEGRHMSAKELKNVWEEVQPGSAVRWNHVRGPVTGAAYALHRIQWRWKDAFTMISDFDEEVSLPAHSPCMLGNMLKQADLRALQRDAASKVQQTIPLLDHEEHHLYQQRRLCFDVAKKYIASSKVDPIGKAITRCLSVGCIWTKTRLKEAGYEVDDVCELCGQPCDDLRHRLYICKHPDVVEARRQALKGRMGPFIHDALGATEWDPLYTRAAFRHPGDFWPRPSQWYEATLVNAQGEICDMEALEGNTDGCMACWDGSCTRLAVPELNRAAWAVSFVDAATAEVRFSLSSPLFGTLPQTPQAAEFAGYAAARSVVPGGMPMIGDCANVVKAANMSRAGQLNPRRMYAGVLRYVEVHAQARSTPVEWVKAHQGNVQLEGAALVSKTANDKADADAKSALSKHTAPTLEQVDEAKILEDNALMVCKLADAVLRIWPPNPRSLARAATEQRQRVRRRKEHVWEPWTNGDGASKLRCARCWATTAAEAKATSRCPGAPRSLMHIRRHPNGHTCAVYRFAQGPIAICMRCGAWAQNRVRKLAEPCPGFAIKGSSGCAALRRVDAGHHPLEPLGQRLTAGNANKKGGTRAITTEVTNIILDNAVAGPPGSSRSNLGSSHVQQVPNPSPRWARIEAMRQRINARHIP